MLALVHLYPFYFYNLVLYFLKFCPILEDCAIFWREETSNFSGDDYDDTQIEDDVFIVFLWSNLNFRIVPDAWLGLCVNCVFSYISEVF